MAWIGSYQIPGLKPGAALRLQGPFGGHLPQLGTEVGTEQGLTATMGGREGLSRPAFSEQPTAQTGSQGSSYAGSAPACVETCTADP